MAQIGVLEGTWEEIKLHDRELSGKRFRLVPVPPEPAKPIAAHRKGGQRSRAEKRTSPRQLTGMGKFAEIIPSSEEFMRQKQEEIELEERNLTR
jgi:hypothetical protein